MTWVCRACKGLGYIFGSLSSVQIRCRTCHGKGWIWE
jgi:DnaJ-class molecular chaperone